MFEISRNRAYTRFCTVISYLLMMRFKRGNDFVNYLRACRRCHTQYRYVRRMPDNNDTAMIRHEFDPRLNRALIVAFWHYQRSVRTRALLFPFARISLGPPEMKSDNIVLRTTRTNNTPCKTSRNVSSIECVSCKIKLELNKVIFSLPYLTLIVLIRYISIIIIFIYRINLDNLELNN